MFTPNTRRLLEMQLSAICLLPHHSLTLFAHATLKLCRLTTLFSENVLFSLDVILYLSKTLRKDELSVRGGLRIYKLERSHQMLLAGLDLCLALVEILILFQFFIVILYLVFNLLSRTFLCYVIKSLTCLQLGGEACSPLHW